jgi:lipoate-protein ligase A
MERPSPEPGIDRVAVEGGFVTDALATLLKTTSTDLHTQLRSGKSIADVATAQNVAIADVKAVLTSDFKAHLAEEVASGKHTQAEADAKLAEFTTRATEMVNKVGGPQAGHKGGPGGKHGKGGFVTDALATVLKTTSTDLHSQLRSGKSIADVATAQNVAIADVKAVLTSDFKAHLAEEVASGKHTQAEADAKLAEFTANLDTMVNRVGPAGGKEGRGHGPREGAPAGMPGAQNTSARA